MRKTKILILGTLSFEKMIEHHISRIYGQKASIDHLALLDAVSALKYHIGKYDIIFSLDETLALHFSPEILRKKLGEENLNIIALCHGNGYLNNLKDKECICFDANLFLKNKLPKEVTNELLLLI